METGGKSTHLAHSTQELLVVHAGDTQHLLCSVFIWGATVKHANWPAAERSVRCWRNSRRRHLSTSLKLSLISKKKKNAFKHTYLSTAWTEYLTSPHAKRFPSCYFLPLLTFHEVQTSIQHTRASPRSFRTPPSAFAFCNRVVRSLRAGWVAKSARTTSKQSTCLDR